MANETMPLLQHKVSSKLSHDKSTKHNIIQPLKAREYDLEIITKNDQEARQVNESDESCDSVEQFRFQSQTMCKTTTIESEVHLSPVQCSNLETMMNLIKGTAGAGILSLPLAFQNSGLWVGLILFLCVSAVTVHCMHIVHNCTGLLEKRSGLIIQSYPDTVELCFRFGPPLLRKFAPIMRKAVTGLIIVIQCGFCCIYITWVAVNIKRVVDQFWMCSLDVRVYEVIISLLLLPYLMVKNLRTLAMFSAFANLIYIIGLIIIFQYMLQDLPDSKIRPAFNSWENMPMFFGTAMFAFENICLIVPLRNKIKSQKDFGGWAGVLNLAMVIIAAVYTAMGFYGCLRFGEDVAATITLNLPQNQWLYLSVNLMLAVAVFLTVGVQFYVPINIIWPVIGRKLSPKRSSMFSENITRAFLLTVISLVAVMVPHIDMLMSLVGSFCGSMLAVIFPAVVEFVTFYEEGKLTPITASKDVAIFIVGVTGFVTGSYTSLADIVATF